MNTHEIKCWPEYFEDLVSGKRSFEIRKNDRDYEVGDMLFVREWSPSSYCASVEGYTGRQVHKIITYISAFRQQEGYIVMAVRDLRTPFIGDTIAHE